MSRFTLLVAQVIFWLSFLSLVSIQNKAHAQGSLQFNQVLSYSGSDSGNWTYASPSWTVPAGKVWKIEAASANIGGAVAQQVEIDPGGGFAAVGLDSYNRLPIWLKAGDQVRLRASRSCCGTANFSYFISIIEFNVVP